MSRNDENTQISLLKKRARKFVEERDWQKYHDPKNLAIAINVEAGELLDLFKWKEVNDATIEGLFNDIREESADIMVYLLHLANALSLDLTESVLEKMKENEKKYPAEDPCVRKRW